jgi:hypothetical protein
MSNAMKIDKRLIQSSWWFIISNKPLIPQALVLGEKGHFQKWLFLYADFQIAESVDIVM